MAGPSLTYCASEYCTGVLHNEHLRRFHSPRPISLHFTKSVVEPNNGFHPNMRTIQLMHLMETNGWGLVDLRRKPEQRKLRNARDVYINKIAPDVREWRNKIAAHRGATDPRSDSLALLTYSTFPTIGYENPYYVVGHIRLTLGDGSSAALPQWSLTQKYEELTPRYWPGQQLTALDW